MPDNVEFSRSVATSENAVPAGFPKAPHASTATPKEAAPAGPGALIAIGLAMIVAILVASAVVGPLEAKTTAPAPAATAAASPAPAAAPEAPAPVAQEFKTQLEGLAAQLKGLRTKVDALPRSEPAPDLAPIQARLGELTRSVGQVQPLTDKVGALDARVAGAETAMKSARDDLKALSSELSAFASELNTHSAAKPVAPASSERGADDSAADKVPPLSEGVALFNAGKYAAAGELFKKVEAANPNDARVYYYEAFVKGITTKDWQGDTLKIATKGASLEKSGATKTAAIDATFADLPESLKPWLAFFRNQAK